MSKIIRDVNLGHHSDKQVMKLSSGLQQRLGIARALIKRPRVLLLDEPTRSLDPAAASQLWILVRRLAHTGTTIVLATHNFEEAVLAADRVAILRKRSIAGTAPDYRPDRRAVTNTILARYRRGKPYALARGGSGVTLDKAAAVIKKTVDVAPLSQWFAVECLRARGELVHVLLPGTRRRSAIPA